ncbi:DUF6090 family protein [Hanstruepera neustonica]|uniref:DUF6090 family protein n=1 Tax=Hanstruepera neustonica TaxID=1445657 RepID=UPI001A9C9398|nr:DUF6090 family protein [Hanstruepera neustonica]
MIKFFRKIRQNLLSEGKTGKYLKYAIGEIVLVVIGILIALQINNWNEGRKANKKEQLILKELRNSINSDLKAYEDFLIPRLERKKSGLDSLQNYIFDKGIIPDSLFLDFYTKLGQDVFMRFDSGPFEALKSNGLDIISNDSLRTAINNAYTAELPIYTFFSNDFYNQNKSEISELQHKFLKLKRVVHEDGRKHIHFDLKVDDILNNQDFLWVFDLERQKYQEFNSRLKQIKTTLSELKIMIEGQLEE